MALLSKTDVAALLGRPLTTVEDTNFDLYLEIAQENIEELLCISLCPDSGERVFERRKEFTTVFTGIFTEINSVKVDDETVTDFTPYLWDNPNAEVFNSIVFDSLPSGTTITVDAEWGFTTIPKDLKRLVAQAFAVVSEKYQVKNVSNKKIEDFSITFSDMTSDDALASNNARVIKKYSLCDIPNIQSGDYCGRI